MLGEIGLKDGKEGDSVFEEDCQRMKVKCQCLDVSLNC